MATITDKLNKIKNAKESIKSSIEAKGIEVGDVSIEEYASKIDQIVGTSDEQLNVTPTKEEQVYEGQYGKVVVAGDNNLVADNIKQGTSIFGVEGTMAQGLDTSLLRNCTSMFAKNTDMTEAPELNLENIISASSMFSGCSNLEKVPSYNLLNATSVSSMFSSCSKLKEIGDIVGDKITNVSSMFSSCSSLETAPNINLINITSLTNFFSSLTKLKNIPEYDARNVTNFMNYCLSCSSLESMGKLQCDKANELTNFLFGCSKLTDVGGFINLGKGYTKQVTNTSSYKLDLSISQNLTHESLMNIINGLYDLNLTYDVANGGTLYTQQLVIGSTNKAKLTAEEIAICTAKGWTVS